VPFDTSVGSLPSVVYHVSCTPAPPVPSPAVSVTVTSVVPHAVGTSSVVVGAALSTRAAAEVFTVVRQSIW